MTQKTRLIIALLLCIGLVVIGNTIYAQKSVQLTNLTSKKKILLKEGNRVSYFLQNSKSGTIGTIDKVEVNLITISGKDVKLDEIKSIGRRRKGSGFLVSLGTFAGVGIIVGSIQSSNSDPCPDCTDGGSSGEGWVVAEVGIGAALIALSINTAVRNSRKDVVTKWKMEVIETPPVENRK
jgi:hypothetical protein